LIFQGSQPPEQKNIESHDDGAPAAVLDEKSENDSNDVSQQAPLLGKPQRYVFVFFVLYYVAFNIYYA